MKKTWSSEDVVSELLRHGWKFDREDGGDAIFVKPGEHYHVKVPKGRKVITPGT